ncbi:MAG TPA: hypothetical protein VKA94_10260 [Hyphomicrobiales bacterium]|nr:hypothetical protein [Hyphomicrobiales bacterium]
MSNERPSKPTQRFSRYSRASYGELAPVQSDDDLSLTKITERVLKGDRIPEPAVAAGRPLPSFEERPVPDYHQPPPPPEADLWNDEPVQPQQRNGRFVHPANESLNARLNALHQPAGTAQLPEPPPQARPAQIKLDEGTQNKEPKSKQREARAQESATVKAKRRETRREKARQGVGAVKSSARTFRDKVGPMLMNGGLWLAHNLRRREIRRRFSRLLVFGHTHLTDRKTERLFFVPSRMAERFDPAPDRGIHYDGPVPVKAFEWVMSFMPDDLREYAFIDVRAGLGRASLLAARYNFKRIVAYEYEPQLFDDLQMNIAQYPRSQMVCRNIDAYRGDINGIVMPDQPCIVYFADAWREPMINELVNYISDTYRQSPRRIYIILENTAANTALEQNNIFDPLEAPMAERLKLRLLSPVDFKVYRSLV